MNFRRVAPVLFAALCLGLCAFILRGQIAARPIPRTAAFEPHGSLDNGNYGDGGNYGDDNPADPAKAAPPSRPTVPPSWHVAQGPARKAALAIINAQLAAIRAGDGNQAWFYQSLGLRRNFASGQAFVAMVGAEYPEFGHAASASYGPLLTDAGGVRAGIRVTVRGRNGSLARAYYWLIKENGAYKVAGVEGGRAIR